MSSRVPIQNKIIRRWLVAGALLYSLLIALMCFLPQSVYPSVKDFSTPGIVQLGRVYFLPIPFNSLVNAGQLKSWYDYVLVVSQNAANIFLLTPLVVCLVLLSEKWQSAQAVIRYSFFISLFIELTQLLLDLLIDAGRVVEVDDLWTNTLGGFLAWWGVKFFQKLYQKRTQRHHKKASF